LYQIFSIHSLKFEARQQTSPFFNGIRAGGSLAFDTYFGVNQSACFPSRQAGMSAKNLLRDDLTAALMKKGAF
jgi:hypothetical protein